MKRKNLFQRLTMPLPELGHYYQERRKERFESNAPFGGVTLRKILHPVLVCCLKLIHLVGNVKITVIGDQRTKTTRPIIYAATHIGWDDVEMIFTAIRDHAYLFWGDPRESYRTMDGFLLDLNGTIICDTDSKPDRYIGKETCIRWLEQNGNLLIFPEGAWNITENLPTMPLYAGVAEMALRTGAEIVPVAIERYGKDYAVNIGANIVCDDFGAEQKWELTALLRDAMATLRWDIWASQPRVSRSEIPSDYRAQEINDIVEQMQGVYVIDDIDATRFRTRAEMEQKDAFAHLDKLMPSKGNAFLLKYK